MSALELIYAHPIWTCVFLCIIGGFTRECLIAWRRK